MVTKVLGIKKSKDIWYRLLRRMDHCNDNNIGALLEDTCGTGTANNAVIRKLEKGTAISECPPPTIVLSRTVTLG